MSQVLVSHPPMPPLATMPLMEAVSLDRPSTQLHLNAVNLAGDREQGAVSLQEKSTASQLAYLASQHHTSEYNRLKFGPGGAPVIYIPLSIQMPAHVRELKARQAQSAKRQVWWPAGLPGNIPSMSDRMPLDQDCLEDPIQQENIVPRAEIVCPTQPEPDVVPWHPTKPVPPLNYPHAINLQRELSVAMSSPLSVITISQLSTPRTFQQRNLSMYAKTSESHPINISTIIPFELLPVISSHLTPAPPHAPNMFELPPSLFLNHVAQHSSLPPGHMRPYPTARFPNGNASHPLSGAGAPTTRPSCLGPWSDHISNGIHAVPAINGPNLVQPDHDQNPGILARGLAGDSEATLLPDNPFSAEQKYSVDSVPPQCSLHPPTTHNRPHSAPPLLLSSLTAPPEVFANGVPALPPFMPELEHAMSSDILSSDGATADTATLATHSSANNIPAPTTWSLKSSPNSIQAPRPTLGNLLLSSCPGKKVRLSGPVKGRGAICRDLGHDLRRVKAMGVGCIICCLDDDELELLGASWPEYSEIARAVGLDVLRIPTPEGLAPTTPASLNHHLSNLIESYTLKGVPILVHCRGGVGRAGLVACCWMLKLGLCGWLSPDLGESNNYFLPEHGRPTIKVRMETVQLVERAIAVVRRRRSVKAIETYEQVRFLVEFVEQLHASGNRTS